MHKPVSKGTSGNGNGSDNGVSKENKVAHVKGATQTRSHHCHWPGCDKQVPPAMWGCKQHWFMLPKYLRDKIWASYRLGQEVNMTPSREYVIVAREVQQWITENHPPEPTEQLLQKVVKEGEKVGTFPPTTTSTRSSKVVTVATLSPPLDFPQRDESGPKLAINIHDLGIVSRETRVRVAKLVNPNPVNMDRNEDDEHGVVFLCDLLMAATICDIIRIGCRRDNVDVVRAYIKKEVWKKLASTTILTVVDEFGRARLNPKVFSVEVQPTKLVAPKAERISLDD